MIYLYFIAVLKKKIKTESIGLNVYINERADLCFLDHIGYIKFITGCSSNTVKVKQMKVYSENLIDSRNPDHACRLLI